LLYDARDAGRVARYFLDHDVDAVFAPHCNFGTEDAVARMAKSVGKPVLLWGPRDDRPLPDGLRTRDSQGGLFATSKVLQRFGVPFTYIENSTLDAPVFAREFQRFLSAVCVVKNFKICASARSAPRPEGFLSVSATRGISSDAWAFRLSPPPYRKLATQWKGLISNPHKDPRLNQAISTNS
jgi:hypothetical protein